MQNMIFKRKLPIPKEIKEQYPLTAELAQVKARRDKEIADVFTGKSGRMVLIMLSIFFLCQKILLFHRFLQQ